MIDYDNPLALIRLLKGAPLSCLFALALAGGPVEARWLCAVTGYSAHAITQALLILQEFQLAACNTRRSAWRLTRGARQLSLAYDPPDYDRGIRDHDRENRDSPLTLAAADVEEAEDGFQDPVREIRDSDREKRDSDREKCISDRGIRDHDRENRDSPLNTTTAADKNVNLFKAAAVIRAPGRENSVRDRTNSDRDRIEHHRDRTNSDRDCTNSDRDRTNSDPANSTLQALYDAGISEPTAGRLAALPHLTPEYVQAHAIRARQEGISTGLLVHRLRCGDPAPSHPKGCTCDSCRQRYTDW